MCYCNSSVVEKGCRVGIKCKFLGRMEGNSVVVVNVVCFIFVNFGLGVKVFRLVMYELFCLV